MNQLQKTFTKTLGICAILGILIMGMPACNPKYGCPSAEQANMSGKKKSKKSKKSRKAKRNTKSGLGFP